MYGSARPRCSPVSSSSRITTQSLVDFIDELGELDNTLIVVLSDNGASAEGGEHGNFNEVLFFNGVPETLEGNIAHYDEWGGPNTYPHYSWGWAWAGNTPFRRWKRETYRGGVSNPCIVSWPARITGHGEIRTQYTHVTDLLPTILDALGLEAPDVIRGIAQSPIHGTSFADSFDDADAPSDHTTQYFEMFGSRSIFHDGWKANCPLPGPSFAEAAEHAAAASGRLSPPTRSKTSMRTDGSCTAWTATRPRHGTWRPTSPNGSPR